MQGTVGTQGIAGNQKTAEAQRVAGNQGIAEVQRAVEAQEIVVTLVAVGERVTMEAKETQGIMGTPGKIKNKPVHVANGDERIN